MKNLKNEAGNLKSRKNIFLKDGTLIIICCVLSLIGGIIGGSIFSSCYNNSSINVNSMSVETSGELSTDEVVEKVADAVVDVSTQSGQQDGSYYVSSSAGSGVIYSENGFIITNNHVIRNAGKITVTLKNGKCYSANIIGADADKDIAVLKINTNGLKVAEFEDYSRVKLGEETIVIGNPLGELGGTVTDGVVSSLNRDIELDGKRMKLLQTCAEINEGNSGGGVFNRNGKLIGIVVAKSTGDNVEGLGFAIPSDVVKSVVEKLIK